MRLRNSSHFSMTQEVSVQLYDESGGLRQVLHSPLGCFLPFLNHSIKVRNQFNQVNDHTR